MTRSSDTVPRMPSGGWRGTAGAVTVALVSSTSVMRSAQTAARGSITSTRVAIRTDIRICMK